MYILLNTAISDQWGFPMPCPEFCNCECFECGNPDCSCGLPRNFCKNLPAHFEIDYVRVYQDENNPKHETGCSTKNRPTAKFIEGHKKRYTVEGRSEPLLPIQRGGGSCVTDDDCGFNEQGYCSAMMSCACEENYTGPFCLSHFGKDDNANSTDERNFSGKVVCVALILCYMLL